MSETARVDNTDAQIRGNRDRLEADAALPVGESQAPAILSFVADWANIVTLVGLSLGVLAVYFALNQNYPAAIIAMLWAVLMDWYDGPIARATPGRSKAHQLIGIQMDSLVDIISLGVVSAALLLSVGDFSPWFYPGALVIIMAGVLRLAYFNVFGVDKNGKIAGFTIDNSAYVVAAVFLFEGVLNHNAFAALLYVAVIAMAILHIAPVRTPKLGKTWYYVVTTYVVAMTGGFSYIMWTE